MASALYWHRTSSPSLEPGMVKELEYVIEQQAKEIESLKEELKAKGAIEKRAEIIQRTEISTCPVPVKPEHLPCTIKDPAAIIAIRGYKDETLQSK